MNTPGILVRDGFFSFSPSPPIEEVKVRGKKWEVACPLRPTWGDEIANEKDARGLPARTRGSEAPWVQARHPCEKASIASAMVRAIPCSVGDSVIVIKSARVPLVGGTRGRGGVRGDVQRILSMPIFGVANILEVLCYKKG